jgi:hypothetical protein
MNANGFGLVAEPAGNGQVLSQSHPQSPRGASAARRMASKTITSDSQVLTYAHPNLGPTRSRSSRTSPSSMNP